MHSKLDHNQIKESEEALAPRGKGRQAEKGV